MEYYQSTDLMCSFRGEYMNKCTEYIENNELTRVITRYSEPCFNSVPEAQREGGILKCSYCCWEDGERADEENGSFGSRPFRISIFYNETSFSGSPMWWVEDICSIQLSDAAAHNVCNVVITNAYCGKSISKVTRIQERPLFSSRLYMGYKAKQNLEQWKFSLFE